MAETLTREQERTLPARRALAAKFTTSEEKSQHYRQLAEKANAGRVVLSGAEAAALAGQAEVLGEAYRLLASIAERARAKQQAPIEAAV